MFSYIHICTPVVYPYGSSSISGGSKGGSTGSDVTGSHMGEDQTGSDRVSMRNRFPRFFLTIVVQNVSLRMTDMATECDVTPKGFPWKGARMCNNIRPSGGLLNGNDVVKRHP